MGVVYFSIIPTFEPSRYCKCWIVCFYIYTRVSTAIQVDGYSLDAQKDKLKYENTFVAKYSNLK